MHSIVSKQILSYVWPSEWGPTYRKSYGICIATAGCMIVMCYMFKLHLERLNKDMEEEERQKDSGEQEFRYLT